MLNDHTKQMTLNNLRTMPIPDYAPFRFSDVTLAETKKHVLAIKSDAVGCDGISRRMILLLLDNITPVLCHLFNFSLSTSTFPSGWQNAFVVPVPKISNPISPTHFRPISILPFLSKVLERIVNKQLSQFLTKNNILSPYQSGFRPGHSTVTALIKVCDDIRQGLDNKLVTILVLLDFSNAFNNVDFDLLLASLSSINVSAAALDFFRSYLNGRQQCVRFDGKCSTSLPLSVGVPQGGVLSPLLFSVFINTISGIISSSFHFYADDLQIYTSETTDNISTAISKINFDLAKISAWCKSYGLAVNPGKSQVIVVGSSRIISRLANLPPVLFDGVVLPFSNTVKNLGLIIDETFSWGPQVAEVGRRIFATTGYLRRWKNFLPFKTKVSLANALLLPILDYGDCCYPDLTQEHLDRLERLQNMCIRFIFGLRKFDHVTEYRAKLQWLSVRRRRDMHALSLLYRVLFYPQTPAYLKERFSFMGADSLIFLRSCSDNKLEIPCCRTKWYGHSFTINCVKLWNSLPSDIRHSKSLNIFKTRLKTYFLSM